MPAPRVALGTHLDPLGPDELALWERYRELAEAAGPSELVVTKSRFTFKAPQRNFTGGFFKSRRLEIFFDLPSPIPERGRDARFRDVWQHSRTIWVHRLKIERVEELDEQLAGWLREAWLRTRSPPRSARDAPGRTVARMRDEALWWLADDERGGAGG